MGKRKSIIIIVVIAVVAIFLALMDFVSFEVPNSIKDYNSIASLINLGIDLKGGYYAILTPVDDSESDGNYDDLLEDATNVLRTRLDNKGYTEATITIQGIGDDREIRIEIPEIEDVDEFMDVIGSSGVLEFRDEAGTVYLTGSDVTRAAVGLDQDGNYAVTLQFTSSGVSKFSQATAATVGKKLYIYLDENVVSAPNVNEQITSSSAQITGTFTYDECDTLASVINAGRLPISFTVGESNRVSASLGENALKASVIAGIIGLLLIFILLILKYRGLGIAGSISLFVYAVVLILLLALIPSIELTLPGIAGIILSFGMAVDTNVIIFERINEEFASGKTVRSSISTGFRRSLLTILDSNITTILAAIVLWILCPGSIKGFAITLLIGIVLSMVSGILLTRGVCGLLYPLSENKEKFFNLNNGGETHEEA